MDYDVDNGTAASRASSVAGRTRISAYNCRELGEGFVCHGYSTRRKSEKYTSCKIDFCRATSCYSLLGFLTFLSNGR